jgi:extracellular elastinolytic metalloproteinase
VRSHRAQLGLDAADLDALRPPAVSTGGTITTVRWRQAVDGIPAADSELRVNLAPDGRVLNVVGDPAHDLDANTTPAVTAGEAVRAVQGAVGVFRSAPPARGPRGATRATAYADGTTAELALDDRRLVWRVTYRASSSAVYDAFVDARSGRVRRAVNMVKSATNATVWESHPGTGPGGAAATVNLEQSSWLAAGAGRLSGRNVHAFSDLDADDFPDAAEEVTPGSYAFQPVIGGPTCTAAKPCSWTGAPNSWQANRAQNAVQAFYFANRFHDHLASAPIDFTDGSFEAGDALLLHTDDGAGEGPDGDHVNNANMYTPPDGTSPVMQMYLWRSPHRAVNSGDDASILYHEYTHGLSNRLVTDAAGRGALNSPQAGAMGEGWSDWYAKDFLVAQFPALDTAAAGDVDMGAYVDATPHSLRSQGLDCPVGASPVACPGAGSAGTGGYTYGDFGKIAGDQEVHADGEIWAETLWDLRAAVGSADARRLITDGMRLSPPEPSFLDMRNAILLADQAAGGARRGAIWTAFANRGMGYAASTSEATAEPAQDFSPPPDAGEPRGRLAGTVRDAATGQPLAGVKAAISGLADGPDALAGTSGADGTFAIASVPARNFPSMIFSVPAYDSVAQPVSVSAGATTAASVAMDRNWAAFAGGEDHARPERR